MTRRSSVRAQAREIYRDLAAKKTADPPSPEGFGGQAAQNLTEKVRALYEGSAVPVREIAAIAGVTERTVYKYARKQRWKPRYRWLARGKADRGRRWRQRPGCAPVKGAGARFIRRADKGQPVATGLKATDPAGAARAVESCGTAESLSREAQPAQHQVEAAQRSDALNRAIEGTGSAFKNLREFHQRRGKGPPGPLDIRVEGVLMRVVTMALARWQALVAEEEGSLVSLPLKGGG